MVLVIPTGTKSYEEVNQVKDALVEEAAAVTVMITETTQSLNVHLKGKMKDSPIFKLKITETKH